MSEIRDISLAPSGEMKISWAKSHMPVLSHLEKQFAEEKPFDGVKVSLSVHLEAKTAYLCRVLQSGGAVMSVTGSNPRRLLFAAALTFLRGMRPRRANMNGTFQWRLITARLP